MAGNKNYFPLPPDHSLVELHGAATARASDARPDPSLLSPAKRLTEFGQLMHRAIERRLARHHRKTDK